MENFNLKKFLVENKLTTNSKMLSENITRGEFMQGLREDLRLADFESADIKQILNPKTGLGKLVGDKWMQNMSNSEYRNSYELSAQEADMIIAEYCEENDVEFIEESPEEETEENK